MRAFALGLLSVLALVSCAPAEKGAGPTTGPSAALIDVSVPSVTLAGVDFQETVSVLVREANGAVISAPPVAWTSDNPAVVEVTSSGTNATLVGRGAGTARIRAVSGKAAGELTVKVLAVRSVSITQSNPTVRAGESIVLSATVEGENGAPQTVRWTSENPAVATVNSQGMLTGVAEGTTAVRAAAVGDPRIAASVNVTITTGRVVNILPQATLLWVGDSKTLSAEPETLPGESKNVVWSSDNLAVATVNAQGSVTAIGVGRANIRATLATDSRVRGEAVVQVLPARFVTVSPAALRVKTGESKRFDANVTIEGGLSTSVTWRTSDPSIASVAADGTVTGVALGTATITAVSVTDTLRKGTALVTVDPSVRSVSVSPSTVELIAGQRDTLAVSVDAEGGLPRTVQWRTANAAVATVTASGVVIGVAQGQTTVMAVSTADTTVRGVATVIVHPAPEVAISPVSATIALGAQRSFTAIVNSPGLPTTVQWRSTNPAIATVSQSGIVTGVTPGTTTISIVATADTTRRASATITVVAVVREVTVTPSSGSAFIGKSFGLTAAVDADPGLSTAVSWRTSNAAVATVGATGTVTGVSAGTATITAVSVADTTKRASAIMTIASQPVQVAVQPSALSLALTQTGSLVATVTGNPGISTSVVWSSANPAVATVNTSGVVTAVAAGATTVTATSVADASKSFVVNVTVVSQPVTVSVQPSSLSLSPSQTGSLFATVAGNPGVSQSVTWSSANPAVATVSSTGVVTAVAGGATTITATSVADPTKTYAVPVSVVSRLASSWSAARVAGALYEDVLSIVPFSSNSAFAVNNVGDVFRWNGSDWTVAVRGSQFGTRFQAVHGSAASNLFAVGTNGVIVRYDGTFWSQVSSGTTVSLLDVFVESASSAYAVGSNGTILRYNGSAWTGATSGTTQTLNAVWAGGGSVVVVGTNGEVLRSTGGAFSRQTVPTTETLFGVSGTTASNVIVVGSFGTILRFNGSAWTTVNANGVSSDFYGVDGSAASSGRMYITSDVGLYQLDNNSLSATATPYQPRLYSAAVDPSGNVWVGGQRGSVQRGTPGSFTTLNLAPDLLDVWSTSASNAWAVGEFGFIYRWNGATWTRQSAPATVTLNAVWAASATEAFAGGDNGVVLRWNGSTWSTLALPTTSSVYSLWGTSATNVYAVTAGGTVYRYNGSSWQTATTTGGALWAVYGITPNEVYVSGENGTLLRYNGSSWQVLSPNTTGILAGLWSGGGNSIVTVGADGSGSAGIAFSYNGSSWLPQSTGTTRVLTSVWGPSESDVYATGDQGTMLRYNGASWSAMATGTTDLLWAVTGAPSGVGGAFAVGYNGTIVTGSNGSGMIASRVAAVTKTSLEPGIAFGQAKARGALPQGKARSTRKFSRRGRG